MGRAARTTPILPAAAAAKAPSAKAAPSPDANPSGERVAGVRRTQIRGIGPIRGGDCDPERDTRKSRRDRGSSPPSSSTSECSAHGPEGKERSGISTGE